MRKETIESSAELFKRQYVIIPRRTAAKVQLHKESFFFFTSIDSDFADHDGDGPPGAFLVVLPALWIALIVLVLLWWRA